MRCCKITGAYLHLHDFFVMSNELRIETPAMTRDNMTRIWGRYGTVDSDEGDSERAIAPITMITTDETCYPFNDVSGIRISHNKSYKGEQNAQDDQSCDHDHGRHCC